MNKAHNSQTNLKPPLLLLLAFIIFLQGCFVSDDNPLENLRRRPVLGTKVEFMDKDKKGTYTWDENENVTSQPTANHTTIYRALEKFHLK